MKSIVSTVVACALCQALPSYAGNAACEVRSGSATAALVELYTSEGCSSCPPADKRLTGFSSATQDKVVPLSLHVDYWDDLGWKDPFAQAGFAERQRWL